MVKVILRNLIKVFSAVSPVFTTKILYFRAFKKRLNLTNPKTLNEKIQWLKLNTYNNNALVTKCVDKYRVREYIKQVGCEEILNELIGVWNNASEIDWDKLPDKFVLKCNHGAGYNIICEDKENFNTQKAELTLSKWMREDYWKLWAEINYKHVEKRIICERFIETDSGLLPDDYKVYCFNGIPKYVMLCRGREDSNTKYYFLNRDWNIVPLNKDSMKIPKDFKLIKPQGIERIFEYAEVLSKPFPFVRVDFYLENGEIYFGELTFTPTAGLDNNRLPNTDIIFGDMLKLPEK